MGHIFFGLVILGQLYYLARTMSAKPVKRDLSVAFSMARLGDDYAGSGSGKRSKFVTE